MESIHGTPHSSAKLADAISEGHVEPVFRLQVYTPSVRYSNEMQPIHKQALAFSELLNSFRNSIIINYLN